MSSAPSTAAAAHGGRTAALFLVSVLGLFLELMLIRWIGTEVRIFAYLQNTVLVVCFLGLGMGCWTCRQPFALRDILIPVCLLVLLLAIPITRETLGGISNMLGGLTGFHMWYQEVNARPWQTVLYAVLGLAMTFVLMALIWDAFIPIGRLLGRLFDDHPHIIRAYSVNVVGSLIGIWLFVLLGALSAPPWVWAGLTAVLIVGIGATGERLRALDGGLLAALVGLSVLAGLERGADEVVWSPYQKLVLIPVTPGGTEVGIFKVNVNNVGYQAIIDNSDANQRKHPDQFDPEMRGLSQYDIPALFHPRPRNALIVGTGTGNDVAGALRQGIPEITAVEIDPVIIDMGRRHHPEKPYDAAGVHVVIDDARSYFARAPEKHFDLIAFGLLDAHTTTAMTNARLDHYVYTRESLVRARDLLTDDGVLVLSFGAERPFIADRIARCLREVFDGHDPLVFNIRTTPYGWGGVMFVTGKEPAQLQKQIDKNPRLKALIAGWQKADAMTLPGTTSVATDDWPYLYLESPSVPLLYFCLAGLLLVLLLRGLRRLKAPGLFRGWQRVHWHFFFLGAAFLLLEVQNISKAAVILGNTWQVNAVIISGILTLVLVANLIVACFPDLPLPPVYVLLCGSCLLLYFVDLSRFAFLPYATKAALVGGLTSLPMLFSGIVFIRSFATVPGKDVALGANLLGALVGGLLQSVTFFTGIKALLLIVLVLYVAALLTRPARTESPVDPVPSPAG